MAPVSASALTCTSLPSLQPRPDQLTSSLAPLSRTAGKSPQAARCPGVETTLVGHLGLASLSGGVKPFSDDLVEQLRDAAICRTGRLLEAGLHRGRHAPCVYFALAGHALQCSASSRQDQRLRP